MGRSPPGRITVVPADSEAKFRMLNYGQQAIGNAEQRHCARVPAVRRCGFAAGVLSSNFSTASALGAVLSFSSRFNVRRQDAAHSFLLICVPASQKPMHASKVSPPPPGRLGADSLGLVVVDPEDPPLPGKVPVTLGPGVVVESPPVAVVVVVVPPGVVTVAPSVPRKVDVVPGVSGATGCTWGAVVPMADGGVTLGVGTGLGGGEASVVPEVSPPGLSEEALAAAAAALLGLLEPPRP